MTKPPKLILASSSIHRKQQLQSLAIDFTAISPEIDESQLEHEKVVGLVQRLARGKALKIQSGYPKAIIIGSDQACTYAGQIYGKPGSYANAVKQLEIFSNHCIEFLTGLCVITPTGHSYTHIDSTVVHFRELSHDEIKRYIDKEQPLDCAGAFKVESLGLSLFNSVESQDPSALMGLPLIKLSEYLREMGFQVP